MKPFHFRNVTHRPQFVSAIKERLAISFFKYHCTMREDESFVIVYEKFSKDFFDKIY